MPTGFAVIIFPGITVILTPGVTAIMSPGVTVCLVCVWCVVREVCVCGVLCVWCVCVCVCVCVHLSNIFFIYVNSFDMIRFERKVSPSIGGVLIQVWF